MTLEDEIANDVAREIANELDWEIISDILKSMGWIPVRLKDQKFIVEIKEWCRTNLVGEYQFRGNTWLLENETDAIMFTLRWL